MATNRLTTARFLSTHLRSDSDYKIESLADAASHVTDNPPLVLVATDLLDCIEAFKEVLEEIGFEV